MEEFNQWFNDGNACKVGANKYVEQSTQYKKYFTLEELITFYKKEYKNNLKSISYGKTKRIRTLAIQSI